jgi:autotransporter-associated beta strand protein
MKPKHPHLLTIGALALVMPATADVIYSNLQDIAIPATFDGLYLNVETGAWNTSMAAPVAGWDINPFYGGRAFANSPDFQPVRSGTGSSSPILNLAAGVTVGSGSTYSTFVQGDGGETPGAPGYGSSQMLTGLGGNFTASTEGYLGFRLNGTNYGSMRVVLTNNTSGAYIKDWAYDTSGASVEVGAIKQVGQDVILSSGFTLASALVNSGGTTNLVKNGSGTNILKAANTYTGATTVSEGILNIASTGSVNTSSGISVAAGAKFVYNSSTALSVAPTLTGNGISNRAVLGGTGTVGTSVTLDNLGDVLSPGNSPGIQNYTPAQSWSSFSYDWEVNNFTGTTAGIAFDQIGVGGTLNLSGGSGSYILNVLGLTAGDVSGNVPNFSEINRSWTILTSTGITGFNAANWSINTTGFTDPDTGTWSLGQSGNNLVLSYAPIPEPRAALLGGLGLLMLLWRRRN